MSNQPLRENLISGYLDNQLSPELRAEVETQLENNADLRALFEILKQQSSQCAAIPKYKLDSGFGDRVLSNPRVETAFSAMTVGQSSPSVRSPYDSIHHSFRTATVAILSLAALVLISLFMLNPESAIDGPVLSQRMDDEIAADPETSGNGVLGKMGQDKSLIVESENDETISRKSEPDFGGRVLDDDLPAGKDGGSSQILATDIERMKQDSVASDLLDALQQQPRPSQMDEANSPEPDYNFQQADEPQSVPEIFGKGEVAQLERKSADELPTDQIANAGREAMVQSVFPSLGQMAARQSSTDVPPDSLDGFIEVKYAGGAEKLFDFTTALSRNEIVINIPSQMENDQLGQKERSVAASEKSGGIGGLGGGGRGGVGSQTLELADKRQAGFIGPGDAVGPGSNSQLFLITATPQQMVGLITDLQSDADVSGYRMPELNPQLTPVQSQEESLLFSAFDGDGSIDGKVAGSDAEFQSQPVPPVAAGEGLVGNKDRAQPVRQNRLELAPDTEKQRAGKAGLGGTSLGIAQTVERQIELRGEQRQQVDPSFRRESKNPGRDMGLPSSQLKVDQADVGELYGYFETRADGVQGTNSEKRQYLLFVHTRDAASDDESQSESVKSVPVPADASESKK